MKITFVINSLSIGGAERVLSDVANHWAAAGHAVTIVTFAESHAAVSFQLDPSIQLTPLSVSLRAYSGIIKFIALPRLLRTLRRALHVSAPDIIVAFMDQANLLTIISAAGLKIPVVVSERIYPRYSSLLTAARYEWLRSALDVLRAWLYRYAACLVVQTERAREYFPPALRSRIEIIANPLPRLNVDSAAGGIPPLCIVGMGRLSAQKRFDLLIGAFEIIAADFPEWSLRIVGNGELQLDLLDQIRKSPCARRIELLAATNNPASLLARAEVFVLSSDYEGFPGVLCEAMALGRACVATDCPAGPRELIEDGVSGILVPPSDAPALAVALARLCRDGEMRARIGTVAQSLRQRLAPEVVLRDWDRLLENYSKHK